MTDETKGFLDWICGRHGTLSTPAAHRNERGQFITEMRTLDKYGIDPSILVEIVEHKQYKKLLEEYRNKAPF